MHTLTLALIHLQPGELPHVCLLSALEEKRWGACACLRACLTLCRWWPSCRNDWHSSRNTSTQMQPPPASLALVRMPVTTHLAQHSFTCESLSSSSKRQKSTLRSENHRQIKGASFPWLPSAIGSLGLGICYWMYNAGCFVLNWSWWGALKACSLVICLSS